MRDAADLPVAEVIRRWRFVLKIFQANVTGKFADGLVSGVPLGDRRGSTGPVDDRRGADMLFLAISSELGKAAQQVLRVAQDIAGGATQGEIPLDSGNHECTPGHGCAMLRSNATSTLA